MLPPMVQAIWLLGSGRVIQAVRRGCLADGQVAHAALHARGTAGGVDRQDAV
jgi:hypothetical protein